MFDSPFSVGVFKRATDAGLLSVKVHNIRDYTHDRHHIVDDYPYGGGAGMVMKPGPVFEAVEAVKSHLSPAEDAERVPVILLTPQGSLFNHEVARRLSQESRLMLICGHYEGVDERIAEHLATMRISIGDYVLTGGELPAMVVADAVVRLVPGVLGSPESTVEDSHSAGLLEYPQYTRPADFRGWAVPEVLLSGNHAAIRKWRREQSLRRTWERRPELLARANLEPEELEFVRQLQQSS